MESNIYFEPDGTDLYNVAYKKEPTIIKNGADIDVLEKICRKEPYNIEAAMLLAKLYMQNNKYDKACQVRFVAASEVVNAIPEDEEYFELDWENPENQELIDVIVASGVDFYMHGDFEMAATLFETALSLDTQDHLEVIPYLAFSYIAIEDVDGYDMIAADIDTNSMIGALIDNFAAYRFKSKAVAKIDATLLSEICAEQHSVDDNFYEQADKDRVDKGTAVREIWYKHLPIFEVFTDFVQYVKQ